MGLIPKKKIKTLNTQKPLAQYNSVSGSEHRINIDIPANGEASLLFLEAVALNDMVMIASTGITMIELDNTPYFRYSGYLSKADAAKVIHKINTNLKS
jgi:hypothetical protein